MKKLTMIIGLLLAFTIPALAQIGAGQYVVVSGTTSGAYAAITNNTTAYPTNAIIDCTRSGQTSVAISWKAELSDAGTTANTITIQESVDKQNWETLTAFTMTPAGTTAATVVTNLTVGASPYLRIYSIANANANTGYMTNYTVRAYVK